MTADVKKYILIWLNLIYISTLEIYNVSTSPDVDIERFSEILINAITQVQRQPELHRCNKAFAKIKNSVGLLQNNFSGYYKDFIQSKNPSTIIESFVIDVSNNESADAQTTREFRKIIAYYSKVSHQSKVRDPKVQKLFDVLQDKVSLLEKSNRKATKDDEDAAESEDTEVTHDDPTKTDRGEPDNGQIE